MKKKTKLVVKMQRHMDAQAEQPTSKVRSQVSLLAVSRKGEVHPAGIVFVGKGLTTDNPLVRLHLEKIKEAFQDKFPQAEHGWVWNELVVEEPASKVRKNRVWSSTPAEYTALGKD